MKRALLSALLLAVTMVAQAGSPPVTIRDARIRWLPGELPMAGYFSITSHASTPLQLVGAASPAFGHVMLHRSLHEGSVARMVHVEAIDLASDQTLVFEPGGYHLMLMHRKKALQPGEEVPVTLRFGNGETLEVPFRVEGAQGE
jgi:periplasmic copper chaperone A